MFKSISTKSEYMHNRFITITITSKYLADDQAASSLISLTICDFFYYTASSVIRTAHPKCCSYFMHTQQCKSITLSLTLLFLMRNIVCMKTLLACNRELLPLTSLLTTTDYNRSLSPYYHVCEPNGVARVA